MRTTLAIDDDVMAAARGLAAQQRKTIGEVLSALARQALRPASTPAASRNGIALLPVRPGATPVTPDVVARLKGEIPE